MIALTHMVWKHDEQLAAEVEEIDLILAGHDHDYGTKCVSIFHRVFTYSDHYLLEKIVR